MRSLGPLGAALGAFAVTTGVAALALWAGGYDAIGAAAALLRGTVGTPDVLLSVTLVRAVPLILTGLAVALAFRAGVWNIGAEGQLYAGAIAAAAVGLAGGGLPAVVLVPATLGAAAAAGALWAAVPAFLRLRAGVGEVISTLLMNFVGIHLAAYMVRGPLQEARRVFPQTDPIAEAARLPALLPGSRLHAGFLVALAAAAALWGILRWTRAGFALRAVGASPEAAKIAGRLDARRVVLVSFLGSGAIAGLAGGVEVAGVTFALYEGLSPGWGYTAIAVALLAGLNPLAVVGTGVLFGILEGGSGAVQRAEGIPSAWVSAMVALSILAVLAVERAARAVEGRRSAAREGSGA